jgi:hypothetical protein
MSAFERIKPLPSAGICCTSAKKRPPPVDGPYPLAPVVGLRRFVSELERATAYPAMPAVRDTAAPRSNARREVVASGIVTSN